MIRTLFSSPGQVDWQLLGVELGAVHPILGVNDVEGSVAVYTEDSLDSTTEASLGLVISNHVPAPPPLDPVVALAHAILDATTIDDVKPVAAQILSDAGVDS